MTLVRWNPRTLDREIDNLVKTFWGDVGTRTRQTWNPSVDIAEHDGHYELHAELPGLSKEDVSVTVNDGVLTIAGEKKRSADFSDENARRTERAYGKFSRSFRLGDKVDAEKIQASYRDGVLTLNVPKAEEVKPRNIEIKVS